MSGSVGVIYRQFSVAMSVSILFSAFLALSFTPALCATILKPVPKGHHESKKGFFGWFNKGFGATTNYYETWEGGSLHTGGRMMLIYLILVIGLGWMYLRLPTSFLPEEDQVYLVAINELPSGPSDNQQPALINTDKTYLENNTTDPKK